MIPFKSASILLRGLGLAALTLGLGLGAGCARGEGSTITREQGDQIIAELREIHRLLAEQPKGKVADKGANPDLPPGIVDVEDGNQAVLGAVNAPVTLIEYTDYQCPFCKRFHDRSWPEIKAKYIDTGKVRYIVRDLPLMDIHPEALAAATAARCAGEQGKFWPVHETLFAASSENPLSGAMIKRTLNGAGIAPGPYDKCAADPRTRTAINTDMAEAERIGVNGTPGFVLGVRKDSKVEGVLILGSQPTDVFTTRIDKLLKDPPHAP